MPATYCGGCGAALIEGARFCGVCGRPTARVASAQSTATPPVPAERASAPTPARPQASLTDTRPTPPRSPVGTTRDTGRIPSPAVPVATVERLAVVRRSRARGFAVRVGTVVAIVATLALAAAGGWIGRGTFDQGNAVAAPAVSLCPVSAGQSVDTCRASRDPIKQRDGFKLWWEGIPNGAAVEFEFDGGGATFTPANIPPSPLDAKLEVGPHVIRVRYRSGETLSPWSEPRFFRVLP